MANSNGSYTRHLSLVRESLVRIEEHLRSIDLRLAEQASRLNDQDRRLGEHAERLGEHETQTAILATRQKVIGGGLVLAVGAVVTFLVERLFG